MKKKQKKTLSLLLILIILIIVVSLIVSSFIDKGTVKITIPKGTSSSRIADILKENDVISSKLYFLTRLSLSEYNGKLQHGTFTIDRNDSLGEIIEILATQGAQKSTVTLTIPEGYSVERIVARAVELGLASKEEFESALLKDYDFEFLRKIPKSPDIKYSLQGFLYPSTYEFFTDASAETVIKTMLAEFEKQTQALNITNLYETITTASLIEREAKLDSERETISGVIKNRIDKNMLLQIDASVVYAISDGMYDVERVLFKDLEIDSPYNTYKYPGLPAGPICSPGIESIMAAITPANHDFLYYHTDTTKNDGSHIFTETFNEHQSTMQ